MANGNYLRLAIRAADKSPHRRFRHGALVTKGGSVLSVGHNHHTVHAEMAACNRVDPKLLRGSTVWSVRLTKSGCKCANAKPCAQCLAELERLGIRKVIYSHWDGRNRELVEMTI